jgi:hypothetical protein
MMRLAGFLVLLAGPAFAQEPVCPFPGQSPMLVVQMFFGQSIRGTSLISHRAWERFVADTITPALPGGFTVYDAHGQWQDPATRVIGREPAAVLVVAAPDTPVLRAGITGIGEAFRRRFDQRSVGIVSTPGCAAF